MPALKQKVSHNSAYAAKAARIKELQIKIQDEAYLNNAIDRIAFVISRSLVENKTLTGNSADFLG